MILNAMDASRDGYIIGATSSTMESSGGGITDVSTRNEGNFFFPEYVTTITMEFSLNPTVEFTDECGKKFLPTPERILAHELGHGYMYLIVGILYTSPSNSDKAVDYENEIIRQIDPNAPIRAVSDHGHGGGIRGILRNP
jgi:hypothetical protein